MDAATEPDDDFVRKFVGHHPGCSVSGSVRVLLSENLRGLDILDVVQPSLDSQPAVGYSQISERQHGCIGRRRAPGHEVHFRRLSWKLQWIEALRHQLHNARHVEVIPQCVVEGLQQRCILGIGCRRLKIGNT